ncbi:Uncharacterized protein PECH_003068 [Penicillium ucsense]|uniref:Condensation domain-containing protein n=1 Tax=Penicillium ucsense TaxID=2839758 RepID=A0A8J8VW89_9EURO|nr:Uncharacterized protein PECM_002571 [Penicillium ucsense]KAF7729927.1 Uncharacterized protein PECH_003068 [Penicillium ucsense]
MDCQWHQAEPGVYQRTATPMERWMTMVTQTGHESGKEHFIISVALRLQVPEEFSAFVPELRRAWGILRQRHSSIASLLDRRAGIWRYVVPTPEDIDDWFTETFIVAPSAMATGPFPSPAHPPKRPRLLALPSTSQIILQAPHTVTDGKGLMLIASELLRITTASTKAQSSYEAVNLSPPFSVAAGLPPVDENDMRRAASDLEHFLSALPAMALSTRIAAGDVRERHRARTKHVLRAFSEHDTQSLLSRLKQRGLTVTHAVHAAIACTTKRFNINPSSDIYAGVLVLDGRSLYQDESNALKHPVSLSCTGWFPTVKVSSFESTANAFKAEYTEIQRDRRLPNVIDGLLMQMMPFLSESAPSSGADALLSSIGVVESVIHHRYSSVEVLDFEIGCEVLTPAIDIFLYTWHDRIRLAAYYNESYYEAETVIQFLAMVISTLRRELMVD